MENTTNDHKGMTGTQQTGAAQPMNSPMQKASEVATEMKQEVGKYVDTAKEQLGEFGDQLKEKGKMAREQLNKAKQYADDYAHENPWKLVGIAAAIGALAALAISGCSRSKKCRHHEE